MDSSLELAPPVLAVFAVLPPVDRRLEECESSGGPVLLLVLPVDESPSDEDVDSSTGADTGRAGGNRCVVTPPDEVEVESVLPGPPDVEVERVLHPGPGVSSSALASSNFNLERGARSGGTVAAITPALCGS